MNGQVISASGYEMIKRKDGIGVNCGREVVETSLKLD